MTLPALYFRLRENGAMVYRVKEDERQGRLDLEPLAFVNVRNGEVRAQGGREISATERTDIDTWANNRRTVLSRRDAEVAERAIEAMNAAAHWVQSKASDDDIGAVDDRLHLAMHDLRSALVRRQSERDDKT